MKQILLILLLFGLSFVGNCQEKRIKPKTLFYKQVNYKTEPTYDSLTHVTKKYVDSKIADIPIVEDTNLSTTDLTQTAPLRRYNAQDKYLVFSALGNGAIAFGTVSGADNGGTTYNLGKVRHTGIHSFEKARFGVGNSAAYSALPLVYDSLQVVTFSTFDQKGKITELKYNGQNPTNFNVTTSANSNDFGDEVNFDTVVHNELDLSNPLNSAIINYINVYNHTITLEVTFQARVMSDGQRVGVEFAIFKDNDIIQSQYVPTYIRGVGNLKEDYVKVSAIVKAVQGTRLRVRGRRAKNQDGTFATAKAPAFLIDPTLTIKRIR